MSICLRGRRINEELPRDYHGGPGVYPVHLGFTPCSPFYKLCGARNLYFVKCWHNELTEKADSDGPAFTVPGSGLRVARTP